MRIVMLVAAAALLGGCDSEPPKPRAQARKDRIEAAEQRLAKTPQPRTYRYADGELRVLQVPVADGYGFVEQQQCFVWRDETFRTATISCSVPPDVGAVPTPAN